MTSPDEKGVMSHDQGHGVDNEAFKLSPEEENNVASDKPQIDDSVKKGGSNHDNQSEKDEADGDVIDSTEVTPRCGIGPWHPKCMQRFKTMAYFSGFFGVSGIMTSALALYISSQITTLEKHFNLSSSLSGLLMSSNEIGFFATCLPLSYLARRVHIPRALALCAMLVGVSGLVCVIPYFGTKDNFSIDKIAVGNETSASKESPGHMCVRGSHIANDSMTSASCNNSSADTGSGSIHGVSDQWRTLAIFLIGAGMAVQGGAKAPRSSYSTVYVDDNVPKIKTPLYLGVILCVVIVGPALSFVVGGIVSGIYITLEDTQLSNRDPRWLGAWWLGFILFGSGSLLAGIPLLCFPRKMIVKPEIAKAEQTRQDKRHGKNVVIVELKGFLLTIMKLLVNPLYMLVTIGSSLTAMSYGGGLAFAPKFMEVHYNQPSWKVNILVGAMSVAPASLGLLISGIITSKFKMSPYACLKLKILVMSVSVLAQAACFLLQCEQTSLIPWSKQPVGNGSVCTSGCQCNMEPYSYFPVCGDDGYNYYSPCHAGCSGSTDDGSSFSNCSCLAQPVYTTARGGLCNGGCETKFYLFNVLAFVSSFCSSLAAMPTVIVALRCVSEIQKPMALGIGPFISSLIGWFPGPIIFGMVIDTACLISQTTVCDADTKGACLLYDLEAFRTKYLGLTVALRFGHLVLVVCAFIYAMTSSKPVFYAHNDEQEIDVKKSPSD